VAFCCHSSGHQGWARPFLTFRGCLFFWAPPVILPRRLVWSLLASHVISLAAFRLFRLGSFDPFLPFCARLDVVPFFLIILLTGYLDSPRTAVSGSFCGSFFPLARFFLTALLRRTIRPARDGFFLAKGNLSKAALIPCRLRPPHHPPPQPPPPPPPSHLLKLSLTVFSLRYVLHRT